MTLFVQGKKMNKINTTSIDSILETKSSGVSIENDLAMPDGKAIAELINDQEKNNETTE